MTEKLNKMSVLEIVCYRKQKKTYSWKEGDNKITERFQSDFSFGILWIKSGFISLVICLQDKDLQKAYRLIIKS